MGNLLIVVDMQNDFIDGSLGTEEAVGIVEYVADKIQNWEGSIIATMDTHPENYLDTNEGKHLPVMHCIEGSEGHKLNDKIQAVLNQHEDTVYLRKPSFGSIELPELVREINPDSIELIGLCTDICVVSNALILKANYPELSISVDASCCAGVTPESHQAALTTMQMCQIEVYNSITK